VRGVRGRRLRLTVGLLRKVLLVHLVVEDHFEVVVGLGITPSL
jgi:hypothetical protein